MGRGELELCVDMSKVAALQDDLDARYKRADILVQWGTPPILALKMQGIPTDEIDAIKWLMENQSPQAAIMSASKEDEKKPAPGEKKPEKFYRIKAKLTPDEKRAMCDGFIAKVFDPSEKPMALALRKYIQDQRNRNLDLVDAWAAKHAKAEGQDEPKVEDFTLSIKSETQRLGLMMYPHYEAVTARAESYAVSKVEAVRMHPVQVDIKEATEGFLKRRLRSLSQVNSTTFKGVEDRLAATLAQARAEELSNQDIARRIREDLQDVYDKRARPYETMRIARTETAVIAGYTQYAVGVDAGMENKSWLDTDDGHTRDSHVKANDQGVIPFDQPFSNGLDYPGDPTGEAEEVIMCRCALQFHGKAG